MQLVHVALAPSSDRKCKHTYTLVEGPDGAHVDFLSRGHLHVTC